MDYQYIKDLIIRMKQENNSHVSFVKIEFDLVKFKMLGWITEEQREELVEIINLETPEKIIE